MIQQHPLGFFIGFIERKQLKALHDEFYSNAFESSDLAETYNLKEEWILDFEAISGSRELIQRKFYFKEYLAKRLNDEKSLAIETLDLFLFNEPNVKRIEVRLATMLSTIESIIEEIKNDKTFKRYPVILDSYTALKEFMLAKSQHVKVPPKPKVGSNASRSDGKLKWIRQDNILATLFYDLLYGQDGGNPYIEASSIEVQRFLANNFVGKEDGSISMESLKTIFTPTRVKKRAMVGTRIELSDEKSKK